MPLSPEAFEQDLLDLLEELRPYALAYYHPLVNGETEKPEELSGWLRNFYIRDFGVLVARAYVKCPHLDARRFLAENLHEEEGRGRAQETHAALSMRLALHFGANEDEVEVAYAEWMKTPEVQAYNEQAAGYDWLEDFASFGLGSEFYAPPLFEMIVERLRSEFGLDDELVKFFLVHMYEDIDHSVRTMKMITRYATSDDAQRKVRDAVRRTIMGLAGNENAKALPSDVVEGLRKRARAAGQAIASA